MRAREGGGCSCQPGYQAQVWSPRDRKTIRKTFRPSPKRGRGGPRSRSPCVAERSARPHDRRSPRQRDEWLEAAGSGVVRTRSGDPYKPSALRSYRQALNTTSSPASATRSQRDQPNTLQDLADRRLAAEGRAASTIRNALHAAARDLPPRPPRDRRRHQPHPRTRAPRRPRTTRPHRPPRRGSRLLDALPARDQRDLRRPPSTPDYDSANSKPSHWNDIDLDDHLIHVERSWDRHAGFDRAQKPRRHPPRPDHPHPPPRTPQPPPPPRKRRPRLRLPQQQRPPLQPQHHQTRTTTPGHTPASTRSASTNAATPTPPT